MRTTSKQELMRSIYHSRKKTTGVTLIELMIVVVIVGILAAIAMPSYTRYILKANRQIGMDLLTTQQYRIQNYLFQFNKSDPALLNKLCGTSTQTNAAGKTGYVCGGDGQYLLTAPSLNSQYQLSQSYTLTALPNGRQEQDGTLLLSYDPATRKFTKQHVTPAGATVDGWDFSPGQ